MANNLSKDQVRDLVYSYQESQVTDQLYDFGKMLLGDVHNRSARINSQSATVLGWATAILAFLFASLGKFSGNIVYFVFGGAVFSLAAVVFAFTALRTRAPWYWPSDQSWIHSTALVSADELKRYHIRVMHDVKKGRLGITNDKSNFLFLGELMLALSALSLFFGISIELGLLTKIIP